VESSEVNSLNWPRRLRGLLEEYLGYIGIELEINEERKKWVQF
jgi:hypothetical protein